jgi:hypothetical protein
MIGPVRPREPSKPAAGQTVPARWRFLPPTEAMSADHVLIDGAPLGRTSRLVLSHWRGVPTPGPLRRDLSTESVLAFLERPWLAGIERVPDAASVDHVDVDGVLGAWALFDPSRALEQRAFVSEVARAGDFAWSRDRQALRAAFALAALLDPDRSGLDPAVFSVAGMERTGRLAAALIEVLPGVLADVPRHRRLWLAEDAAIAASEADLAAGRIRLREHPDVDLVVVEADQDTPRRFATLLGRPWPARCHPAVVHAASSALAVLEIAGDEVELRYRYESWVETASFAPRPRRELYDLAQELEAAEPGGARWSWSGAAATLARLRVAPATDLDPSAVEAAVVAHLGRPASPPRWGWQH